MSVNLAINLVDREITRYYLVSVKKCGRETGKMRRTAKRKDLVCCCCVVCNALRSSEAQHTQYFSWISPANGILCRLFGFVYICAVSSFSWKQKALFWIETISRVEFNAKWIPLVNTHTHAHTHQKSKQNERRHRQKSNKQLFIPYGAMERSHHTRCNYSVIFDLSATQHTNNIPHRAHIFVSLLRILINQIFRWILIIQI